MCLYELKKYVKILEESKEENETCYKIFEYILLDSVN